MADKFVGKVKYINRGEALFVSDDGDKSLIAPPAIQYALNREGRGVAFEVAHLEGKITKVTKV